MGCRSASAPAGTPCFEGVSFICHTEATVTPDSCPSLLFFSRYIVLQSAELYKILFFLFFTLLHIHTNYNKDEPNYGVSIKHSDDNENFVNFNNLLTVFFSHKTMSSVVYESNVIFGEDKNYFMTLFKAVKLQKCNILCETLPHYW